MEVNVDVEKTVQAATRVIRVAGPVIALLLLVIVCATVLLYAHPELSTPLVNILGSLFNEKTGAHWETVITVILLFAAFKSRIKTLEEVITRQQGKIDRQQEEIDDSNNETHLCEARSAAVKGLFLKYVIPMMPKAKQAHVVREIETDIQIAEDQARLKFVKRQTERTGEFQRRKSDKADRKPAE